MKKSCIHLKVMFAVFTMASMLFVTSCKHEVPQDEPEQEDKGPEATLKIVLGENNQVKFTYAEDEENNTLTFTAEDGYDSYGWMMVGSRKPLGFVESTLETGKSITISLEDFTDSFSIMLMAAKNGIEYTTNMIVDMCPPVMVYILKILN